MSSTSPARRRQIFRPANLAQAFLGLFAIHLGVTVLADAPLGGTWAWSLPVLLVLLGVMALGAIRRGR